MCHGKEVWRLDRITLYNEARTEAIVMPRVKAIRVGAKEESRRTTMVSGKTVKDVLGYRTIINAEWDWLPVGLAAQLAVLLRHNSFLWVEYPSPTGPASGWFESSYPIMRVFCYKNSEAVWHEVALELTAKEVS